MVNNNMTNGDMAVEDGVCKPQVNTRPEHRDYFKLLHLGELEADVSGQVIFRSFTDRTEYGVVRFGPSETAYVDDVFGNGDMKGVIGRVALENSCNAFSLGRPSFVRGQSNGKAFSIECTPFQVYQIA